jgi:hypothetical protein
MNNKAVILTRYHMPDNPVLGYDDDYEILEDNTPLRTGHCRTCPNAFMPKHPEKTWFNNYALVAPFTGTFKCVVTEKFGKCLSVNNNGEVPTINPDKNNGGKFFAKGIACHSGGIKSHNPNWPGSKGCFTFHPKEWSAFIACFEVGETGIFILQDLTKDTKNGNTKKNGSSIL